MRELSSRRTLARHAVGMMVLAIMLVLSASAAHADSSTHSKPAELILAGDGGNLSKEARSLLVKYLPGLAPGSVLILMGDNVYPRGIPAPQEKEHAEALERLYRQIELSKLFKLKTIFIPGNHDWDNSNKNGLQAVRRQQEIIERELGANSFAPRNGCPGPVVAHRDANFEIIALDSQWWMHKYEKPDGPEDGCETYSDETILQTLNELLSLPRQSHLRVLVQHHPLKSVGPNGYGSSRGQGKHWRYKEMKQKISAILKDHPVDVCAAGHEHSLQMGEGVTPGCRFSIVSGTLTNAQPLTGREGKFQIIGKPGFFSITAPGPKITLVK